MKILILGSTGTVGNVLFARLKEESSWKIYGTTTSNLPSEDRIEFHWPKVKIGELFGNCGPDVVINCAAKLNSSKLSDDVTLQKETFDLNALLPAALNEREGRIKMIHVSTDAVFSGERPPYDEDSVTDGESYYGKTKIAGENYLNNALILRGSILGKSRYRDISIPNLIRGANGERKLLVPVNEFWNGVTAHAFSEFVVSLIRKYGTDFANGVRHIVPEDVVSKFDLFCMVANKVSKTKEMINGINAEMPKSVVLSTKHAHFNEEIWNNSIFKKAPSILEMINSASL